MFVRKSIFAYCVRTYCNKVAQPLRSKKPKSTSLKVSNEFITRTKKPWDVLNDYTESQAQNFIDFKRVRTFGGKGGDGCISFLHLWSNEHAGPDGGDGGNGGHVILKASTHITDLTHVNTILRADSGEKGANKDCNGKNAEHKVINVPIGTIIKDKEGKVIGDLYAEGVMFVAARGGAGGKGNHFFISDTEQSPEICEYGAQGEELEYTVELRSMAHVGLIGFPNAGKSTLLRAISRARPKVAPYPFTTLKPHIGIIKYDDYEQIAVADLPGLIEDSHKNKGLGINFLRHAERCSALLYIIDASLPNPWQHLTSLQFELSQFSGALLDRPQLVVANKMDVPAAAENFKEFKKNTDLKIISISAKLGTNVSELLQEIRVLYDHQNT